MNQFPKIIKVKQRFQGPVVADIDQAIAEQLQEVQLQEKIKPGMRIAITAGSRGIANIADIIRAVVWQLKQLDAQPFIVPAMGSHGGATADGQVEVLASLGVTEEFCGAPIHASMEVVHIGDTPAGLPVHTDKLAWEADAILLINRIKAHTDYHSPIGIESGLMKMAAIGLGKHKQALLIHRNGVQGLRDMMPDVARIVLKQANILCGIGILENAFEQTAKIEAIAPGQIEERESELLQESKALMPSLPVKDIDVLMVDEIGKDYSGTGMDTNIIGRIRILGVDEPQEPRIKYIIASDVSEASHGNALGIGLADVTTQRLFTKVDFQKMNENVITSSFLQRANIPIILENDREAIRTALRCNWGVEPDQARFVRIPNTLELKYLYVSEAVLPDLVHQDHIEVMGEVQEMNFDAQGYLPKWTNEI